MPDPTLPPENGGSITDTSLANNDNTNITLPPFLSLSRSAILNKYEDLEWEQRERIRQGLQAEPEADCRWTLLAGDDYAKRNRYANVTVFANNRVKLHVAEGQSDYINASPIRLRSTATGQEKHYIATQGPKEGIHSHIWRMIWQQSSDPAVIVMLTQTHESGREKCFQYFPLSMDEPTMSISEDDEFDDDFKATLTLQSIEEDASTQSVIRELELRTEDGATKKVWHFLFSGWPDFSIPEDDSRDALVRLIQLSAAKTASATSPRIVHCSAGVGRSGTFIALDWLLTELEDGCLDGTSSDFDPIAEVVDELRQQRMMMVQSDAQFTFLYDLLRQLWKTRQATGQVLAAPGETVAAQTSEDGNTELSRAELEREMQGNVASSLGVP